MRLPSETRWALQEADELLEWLAGGRSVVRGLGELNERARVALRHFPVSDWELRAMMETKRKHEK